MQVLRSGLMMIMLVTTGAAADHASYGLASGHDLMAACASPTSAGSREAARPDSRCRDYLSGLYRAVIHLRDNDCVSDVQELSWRAEVECLRNVPEELGFEQLLQIVTEYGKAHPEVLADPPAELVKAALSATFP